MNYILMFCFFYNVTSKITTYTPIAFILIFIIANYLIPIFKFRNIKGINNRIQKSKQEKEGSVSILQAVRNKYGLKAVIVIIFCSTIMGNMYLIQQKGMQDAQYEKEYLVTNTPTPMIIIDTYKDYFIIAPVDLATKTITPKFKLLKQSKDMPDLPEFEWKKIGPLKVSD